MLHRRCCRVHLSLLIDPVVRPKASRNVVTPLPSVRAVPVTRPTASWKVVTPLASVRELPVTRPWASWKRTSWASAGASVASVVKSAMVMSRMVDLIVCPLARERACRSAGVIGWLKIAWRPIASPSFLRYRCRMGLLPTCQIFVDEFLAAIAPFEVAFKDAGFSYLALKFGERFIIKQGRLFLNTYAPKAQSKHFRSVRVRAGYYPLAELKLDLRGFIERLLGGELQTPDGVLHFPAA